MSTLNRSMNNWYYSDNQTVSDFLDKFKIKTGKVADSSDYGPTPLCIVDSIFSFILSRRKESHINLLDFGSGDFRFSFIGCANGFNVDAVEKDEYVSIKAKTILDEAILNGIVDGGRIRFLNSTSALDIPWMEYDVVIFNYTEPTDPVSFRRMFSEKCMETKPGSFIALTVVNAYMEVENPITSYLSLILDLVESSSLSGREIRIYERTDPR